MGSSPKLSTTSFWAPKWRSKLADGHGATQETEPECSCWGRALQSPLLQLYTSAHFSEVGFSHPP